MLKRKLSNEIRITRYRQHFADTEKSRSLDICLPLPCADFSLTPAFFETETNRPKHLPPNLHAIEKYHVWIHLSFMYKIRKRKFGCSYFSFYEGVMSCVLRKKQQQQVNLSSWRGGLSLNPAQKQSSTDLYRLQRTWSLFAHEQLRLVEKPLFQGQR